MLFKKYTVIFFVVVTRAADLNLQINNGLIRGREGKTVGLNVTYRAYQGIPFAEPPVGELRFKPPVPKSNWDGVLDATQDGNICVQNTPPDGSEDCLFINIYVPETQKGLLPTMVWIYGGGFAGGGSTYKLFAPDYLIEKEVVVVTFNYRLGVFGFLSTGDLVVPGNNGLKDQVLALKWVKNNIEHFGGDPNNVTVFGQSSGSASIAYLMQSPLAKDLFHKAIMESGVSLNLWALSRRVPEVVKKIARNLNIYTEDFQELVDELREIDYELLQNKTSDVVAWEFVINNPRDGFVLGPVSEPDHEGAFFSGKSHQILTDGQFAKIPCIVGFNSLEGSYDFGDLIKVYLIRYDLNPIDLLPIDLNVQGILFKKLEAAITIKSFYFGFAPVWVDDMKLMEYISDDQFVRPIREFVRQVSKHAPVYFYRFSYEGGLWGLQNRTHPGVTHSEELGYLWGSNFKPSPRDLITRERMTTMWTNFAKTGDPGAFWNQSDANFTYLDIGQDLVLGQFPEKSGMEMWDRIYQIYGNPPYDTY